MELNQSNGIHYDVVLDVNADDSTESISQTSLSDDIHNFEAKKETVTKQQSKNTSHSEQKQTESTFTEKDAKPHSSKRQHKLQHNIKHCQKKPRLVNDQKPYKTPCVSIENELHSNIKITHAKLNLGGNASFAFFPCNEESQPLMCSIMNLPLVLEHAVKPSKKLGQPSKLIHILGDGNCLFRAFSYVITGRQVYHTKVREQIINHMRHIEHFLLPHMKTSLDSYLATCRSHMARNGVWGTDIEILSAASLLSTDVFVYTKFGETYKWQKFSRTMLDGKKPENDCSIYLNHSNGIHYDVVLDVNADDSTESISQTSLSDDIHNFEAIK